MIRIQAPDGSVVEFPDGTDDDTITKVMRAEFGGPQQPPPAQPAQPATAGQSFAQGLGDPIHGGAQLAVNALPGGVVDAVNSATAWVNRQPVIGPVTRALGMVPATREQVNENVSRREADYQASRQAAGATGTDWWRMAGNTAGSLPAAVALPTGGSLLGSLGAGAATGAAMSAAQPVAEGNYWEQKKQQVETGGALGAVSGPAGYLLGRAMAPNVSQNARTLHAAGVRMTPGQVMGGAAQRFEDAATAVPFVGDAVRAAQRRGVHDFNRAAANEALAPLGQKLDDAFPAGREMVAEVQRRVSAAYDDAVQQAKPFGPDAQFAQDVQGIAQRFLTPESGATFVQKLKNDIASRMKGGQLDGEAYQTIKSELGRLASQYGGAGSAADRELGAAFGAVQEAMKGLLVRQNPQAAPLFQAADRAYAAAARLNDATSRVAAVDGVFTPAQFTGAVRAGDKSVDKRAFARGDAMLQELADAGRSVLPSTVPDSGTASRLLTALLAGGAGLNPAVVLPAVGAGAAVSGAYTPLAAKLAQQLMLRQPSAPVQAAGNALAASGGAAAVPLGALLLAPPSPPERR